MSGTKIIRQLNQREYEREPARLNVAVASACVPVKRGIFSGGRRGYSLHFGFVCPGRATIGGLASFGSSWLTQRTQLRFSHYETIKAKREALYAEFVDEASRLYGDALGHQKDDAADLAKLFALLGRIRLASPRPVVTAAERTFDTIIEAYLGPNRTMHEVLDDVHQGGFHFLIEFGEACRQDLGRD